MANHGAAHELGFGEFGSGEAGTARSGQVRHDRVGFGAAGTAGGVCSKMVCPGEVGSVKAWPGQAGPSKFSEEKIWIVSTKMSVRTA